MFMKTFEERYTAWIDGRLEGADLHAFEQELADRPDAEADRRDAHRLGDLLRRHASAPALTHADFFSAQLAEKIAFDERRAAPPARRFGFSWLLPHLAWGGVCCLLLSFVVYREWVAPSQRTVSARSRSTPVGGEIISASYNAHVLQSQPGDPGIYATPVHSKKDGVTVLWLDGLDYLPASYQLQ